MLVAVLLAHNYEYILRGKSLLPVYCQNTLVALILMISNGFYNFLKRLKVCFLNQRFFLNDAMLCVWNRQTKRDRETQRKLMKSSKIGFPDYRARDRDKEIEIERNRDRQAGYIQRQR
jgi:hypothetical protein